MTRLGPITGQELRGYRLSLALSQRELADLLGVQQSTVWRWEAERAIARPAWLRLALDRLVDLATRGLAYPTR